MSRLFFILSLILVALVGWPPPQPAHSSPTCPANPFTLTNGTTADANQVMSIFNNLRTCNSNAAANGANSDITSLSALSTPLTVAQGGTGSAVGPVIRSYLAGYGLSNDVTNPNTTLDIAVGYATDSTNAVAISLGSAITKLVKTQGGTTCTNTWVAGTGNCGMVTAAVANHWLYVCAILNAGTADVYFEDITANAANVCGHNAPAGTTAFRYIGSILLTAGTNITTFVQTGDYFRWKASVAEFNDTNPGTSAVTKTLTGVPPGIITQVLANVAGVANATFYSAYFSDPAANDEAPSNGATAPGGNMAVFFNGLIQIPLQINDNTSQQVRYRISASDANVGIRWVTLGWVDTRGKLN